MAVALSKLSGSEPVQVYILTFNMNDSSGPLHTVVVQVYTLPVQVYSPSIQLTAVALSTLLGLQLVQVYSPSVQMTAVALSTLLGSEPVQVYSPSK